ncbi:SAP domain-containing protein [Ammoniphilus oxalaticus]|nr:SAP domain-containing protein [Ammoniphilus oxalaticus]
MNKEHVNDSLVEIIGEVETDISKMTVAELKEFAATKGIDLTGVDKKDEILTVIQSHIEPDEQEQ